MTVLSKISLKRFILMEFLRASSGSFGATVVTTIDNSSLGLCATVCLRVNSGTVPSIVIEF